MDLAREPEACIPYGRLKGCEPMLLDRHVSSWGRCELVSLLDGKRGRSAA